MLNKNSVFVEMQELNNEILYHADLYFNKDNAEIPNHVYDDMVKRFDELKANNPEIAELFEIQNKPVPIHEPTGAGLDVVTFDNPMLSLKKALSIEEVTAFTDKHPDEEFVDEYKLDGIALSLFYERQPDTWMHLKSITTRGSGLEGEDVTHALPMFQEGQIPTIIKVENKDIKSFEVRGEGYLPIYNFDSYNEIAPKPKTTPRNAASGFVRALEKNQDKNAKGLVHFGIYWTDTTFGRKTYKDLLLWWRLMGFRISPEANEDDYRRNRYLPEIPVDGIVKKINSLAKWDELGVTNKYPNYAIAYKFPNEEKETEPVSVDWQVGKTGRVVPCINYKPVRLGGVMCDRASLDNIYQFLALELRADSIISISRNGDVIPRLHSVVDGGHGELFKAPTECPSCGSVLETRTSKLSADLICNNVSECPAQLLMRCVALVGKRCLDIEDLGPVKLGQLIDFGVINDTSDVVSILKVSHVGQKVYDRIEAARRQPWHILIKALGLPGVDITRAKKLADALPEDLRNDRAPTTNALDFLKDPEQVRKVPGFGPGLTLKITSALRREAFWENARDLLKWLNCTPYTGPVCDLKGVITGSLGPVREELIEYFGNHGIELVEDLTKDCQFLLKGEKPSKSKVLKATALGIPMLEGSKASSIDQLITAIKEMQQ
ncbi:DNA ligase [compost metagenome]